MKATGRRIRWLTWNKAPCLYLQVDELGPAYENPAWVLVVK